LRPHAHRVRRLDFVPTGQTGIIIAGWGISVDRVIADFAPGAAEQLVLYAAHEGADLIVVEGQGAINHPAYAPVTLALMTGARRMRCCSSAIRRAHAALRVFASVVDPRRAAFRGAERTRLAQFDVRALRRNR
jgi:uncharacterized NAD-dependent epimerase/dehydratase family protein